MRTSAQVMEAVIKMMASEDSRSHLVPRFTNKDLKTRFDALRQFYKMALPEIMEAGKSAWGIDPYEGNWIAVFTPIEAALWSDIRMCDAVLYPQFPVGPYFVDFANPVAKVAIECDGAAFHKDKAKDAKRDDALRGMGWSVYRLPGWACNTDSDEETGQIGPAGAFVRRVVASHRICRSDRYALFNEQVSRYEEGAHCE